MALPARGFRTPAEVTSYFAAKGDQPSFAFQDVYAEEHALAFTVAKAVDAELRGAFRRTIGTAIGESQSFETWRKEIGQELTRLGWAKPRIVSDPTGRDPDKLVDFSSRRRLETIFWSNMRSARAAGQWQRIQKSKRALPYLLYVRSASAEPRPEHLAWVGIILPVDDPFWATHFPPNGWGCKCSVRQITRREAERLLGSTPDPEDENAIRYTSDPADFGMREYRNRRTGEVREVPVGIDPGWETNPGLTRTRTLVDRLQTELDTTAAAPGGSKDAGRIVEELWDDPFLKLAPDLGEVVSLPAGVNPKLAAALDASSPIVTIGSDVVREGMRSGLTIDDFAGLPRLVGSGAIVEAGPGTQVVSARVALASGEESGWTATIRSGDSGRAIVTGIEIGSAEAVAMRILQAGLGTDGLRSAGFAEEAIIRLLALFEDRSS